MAQALKIPFMQVLLTKLNPLIHRDLKWPDTLSVRQVWLTILERNALKG